VCSTTELLVPALPVLTLANLAQYATHMFARRLSFGSVMNATSVRMEDAASSAVRQVRSDPFIRVTSG
jgi:hypothetical protein